jgi:hypothetical protein
MTFRGKTRRFPPSKDHPSGSRASPALPEVQVGLPRCVFLYLCLDMPPYPSAGALLRAQSQRGDLKRRHCVGRARDKAWVKGPDQARGPEPADRRRWARADGQSDLVAHRGLMRLLELPA